MNNNESQEMKEMKEIKKMVGAFRSELKRALKVNNPSFLAVLARDYKSYHERLNFLVPNLPKDKKTQIEVAKLSRIFERLQEKAANAAGIKVEAARKPEANPKKDKMAASSSEERTFSGSETLSTSSQSSSSVTLPKVEAAKLDNFNTQAESVLGKIKATIEVESISKGDQAKLKEWQEKITALMKKMPESPNKEAHIVRLNQVATAINGWVDQCLSQPTVQSVKEKTAAPAAGLQNTNLSENRVKPQEADYALSAISTSAASATEKQQPVSMGPPPPTNVPPPPQIPLAQSLEDKLREALAKHKVKASPGAGYEEGVQAQVPPPQSAPVVNAATPLPQDSSSHVTIMKEMAGKQPVNDLLAQIREGKELRKVSEVEVEKPAQGNSQGNEAVLAKALGARRKDIEGQDNKKDNEWDDVPDDQPTSPRPGGKRG